jgi:hypothetical protein
LSETSVDLPAPFTPAMIQNSGGVNSGLYQLSIGPAVIRAWGDFNDGAVLFSVDGQPGLMMARNRCLGGSLEMVRHLNCERLGHEVTSPFRSRVEDFMYFSRRSGLYWHLSSQEEYTQIERRFPSSAIWMLNQTCGVRALES